MLKQLRSRLTDRPRGGHDGGFVLLESIISISLIVIVMAGLTNFFVSVTSLSGQLRARQAAVMFADTIGDRIRGYQPTDLVLGRTASMVKAEFTACTAAPTKTAPCAPAQVAPLLTQMNQLSDDTNGGAKVPMAIDSTSTSANGNSSNGNKNNGTIYTAYTYVGSCVQPISNSYSDCVKTAPVVSSKPVPVANMIRVVIAVTWPSAKCALKSCTFVTSTLLSSDSDPTFLTNLTPPNPPQINAVANQTSAINDSVALQLSLTSSDVVTPIVWTAYVNNATTLPAGLTIDADSGLITGSPSGPVGTSTVTITATDGFGRTDTEVFTWKILADLTISGFTPTSPATAQVGLQTPMTLAGAGGSGGGYSIAVPLLGAGTMPPGMIFNALTNKVSGAATTSGTYTVPFTITDGAGRKRTYNYTWVILDKPTISIASSTMAVMPGWTATQEVDWTCPTGSCTLTYTPGTGATAANGLAGMVLSTTPGGARATSATAPYTVAVTGTSGALYLTGVPTVPTATGPTTTAAFSFGISDSFGQPITAASTTWTLYKAATNALDNAAVANGSGAISFSGTQTSTTNAVCATACTVSLAGVSTATPTVNLAGNWLSTASTNGSNNANAPTPALSYSIPANPMTFYVRGNLTGSWAKGTYNMLLTITDSNGNTLTEPAVWTIS